MTKPPYSVMTMDEIRSLPGNGFNAVSTFSGCGGSSTGYRMAGFRMLYASEIVPVAQECYRANAAPHTYVDGRDIREVTASGLMAAAGVGVGEIDLFDGSPPCTPFSTAGKREAGWGVARQHSGVSQRVDDLSFEYVRLIRETQPRTFVMENVAGLVRGTAKGYFLEILAALKACGYRVSARILNASWLGVPQSRNRLIFVGVRNDLETAPAHPSPLPYRYTVRDALPYIGAWYKRRYGGEVAACLAERPLDTIIGQSQHLAVAEDGRVAGPSQVDPETGQELSMIGYAVYEEWRKLKPGQKSPKYFHVRRQHLDEPYDTILAAQGDVTITGPAHWTEPRKLNLIELRALGGFPPDFILTGTYAQRWERIGNAVPPVMMRAIAETVRDQILTPLRETGRI